MKDQNLVKRKPQMNLKEKIFVFGKGPGEKVNFQESFPHPRDPSESVRFVKDSRDGVLYFNMKDFLSPYKNKKYISVVSNIIPRRYRNLSRVWMRTTAWAEIKRGIDEGRETEVIEGWKERLLF